MSRFASWVSAIWISLQAVLALAYIGMFASNTIPFRECVGNLKLNEVSIEKTPYRVLPVVANLSILTARLHCDGQQWTGVPGADISNAVLAQSSLLWTAGSRPHWPMDCGHVVVGKPKESLEYKD